MTSAICLTDSNSNTRASCCTVNICAPCKQQLVRFGNFTCPQCRRYSAETMEMTLRAATLASDTKFLVEMIQDHWETVLSVCSPSDLSAVVSEAIKGGFISERQMLEYRLHKLQNSFTELRSNE